MNILNKSKLATVFFGGFLCGVTYLISCGKVNTNEAGASGGTTRYVKANGVSVGELVSVANELAEYNDGEHRKTMAIMSTTGYLVFISRDGSVDRDHLYFASSDCTGQAYSRFAPTKSVFRNANSLWYVSSSAQEEATLAYNSISNPVTGACSQTTSTHSRVIAATPNNSTITGLSQTSFTPPITIE